MAELPADVGTGIIRVQVQGMEMVGGGVIGNHIPGKVTFTPRPTHLTHVGSGTIYPTVPISIYLRKNVLVPATLVATDDPQITPVLWTYQVTFELESGAQIASFDVTVPEGSDRELSDIIPVQDNTGVFYNAQGPPGPQGPAGPAGADGADGADGGVTDHGLLTGLLDDDHTQYHNDTRGDVRYYTKGAVDTALSGKSATSHTHAAADTVSGIFAAARLPAATEAQAGAVELATNGETTTGTDTTRAVTPAGVKAVADTKAALSHTHVATNDLTATGTKNNTTYLRGDNTWAVPEGSSASGLPAGIGSPDDFTAIDGAVINAGTSTTGFFSGTATATVDSLACVRTQVSTTAGQTAGLTITPQTTTGKKFVAVDMAWASVDGFAYNIADLQHLKITDGAALAGNASTVTIPAFPQNKWLTMVIPVNALTEVESIGVINDISAGYQTGGQKINNYWRNIRWANQTEADQALQEGAALLSPTYTPGITAEVTTPVPGKTRVNLDPDVAWIDRLGGVRHIREWGVPEDGLTECSILIAQALGELSYGDTLLFPPNGFYWTDYPIRIPAGITVNFNGSTLFTRVFKGGNNNVQDPVLGVYASNVTLKRPRIFGFRQASYNGSDLSAVAGSPSNSSTNKLLDAQGESVHMLTVNAKVPWYARYPLVMFPSAVRTLITNTYPTFKLGNAWTFTLSDSAQVANDCILEAVNEQTNVVEATRTLTLTNIPTEYVLAWTPTNLEAKVSVRVRKATATANTITIASTKLFGFTQYSASNDSANAIQVVGAQNVLIEDYHVEGAATDAIDCTSAANDGIVVRNGVSRCCSRQGLSFNLGKNGVFDGAWIIGPHRSGVDVEPYALDWVVSNMTIKNMRIVGAENWGIAMNNWAGVKDLVVDNLTVERCLVGTFIGGARGALITNIKGDGALSFKGQNMRGGDLVGSNLIISNESAIIDDGGKLLASATGTGSSSNTMAVDSVASLVVGQRVHIVNTNQVVTPNVRITAIASLNVTFDGSAISWAAGADMYHETAYVESSDNIFTDVTVTTGTSARITGRNKVINLRGSGGLPINNNVALLTGLGGTQAQRVEEQDGLTRTFNRSFVSDRSTEPPFTYGGLNLRGQALNGLRGLSSKVNTATVLQVENTNVTRGTGSSTDLGMRGLPVTFNLATWFAGTPGRISVTLETSQDNTNWYTLGSFPDVLVSGQGEVMHVRFCERYVRAQYLITGTANPLAYASVTALSYVPSRNVSGTWTGSSSTTATVTFPSKGGPAIASFSLSAGTGGTLTPSTTYYYRIGARTREAGPATWLAQQSVALGGSQNAVSFNLSVWHAGTPWWTDGFSVLRGTSSGTYTVRYDVLPKADVETFDLRHESAWWGDNGAYFNPASEYPDHPITYQTASPKLTATDESGLERDNAYQLITSPAYTSITKRTDGFDVTFGSALTSFDWFLVR